MRTSDRERERERERKKKLRHPTKLIYCVQCASKLLCKPIRENTEHFKIQYKDQSADLGIISSFQTRVYKPLLYKKGDSIKLIKQTYLCLLLY